MDMDNSQDRRWLRWPFALMLALTFVVSAAGAGGAQDGAAEASASVRFVHASPDAPALDILVDGQPVAQGLEFGALTEFAPVSDGDHTIQIVPAGEAVASALIEETIGTDGDSAYTVAVANLLNALELSVVESNLDDLPEGEARVRLVNLSPDDESVDLAQVGGDEWFDDIEFGEASDHRNVEEGAYDLDISVHDADVALISVSGVQVDRGGEVSLYLIGSQASGSLQVLTLTAGVNSPCAIQLGLSELDDDACVRITQAALDAPPVDVYLEESLVVEGLEPGGSSEFLAVPAGDDRSFVIVPAGGALEDQILESEVDLEGGNAVDVIIGGDVNDLKVVNDDLDLSPVASDQARVRTVNLSPDAGEIDLLVTDGDTLFGDVDFEQFSDAILMDADTYDIQVQAAGEDVILFQSEALTIEPEMSYSLIAAGSVESGTFTVLVLTAPAQVRTGEATSEPAPSDATPLGGTTPTPAAEEIEATPTS